MNRRLTTTKAIYILVLSFLVYSCSVDITGAPCSTNENCPNGQRCENGRCVRGTAGDVSLIDVLPSTDTLSDTSELADKIDDISDSGVPDSEEITDISYKKCKTDEECQSDVGKFICINNVCIPGECRKNEDCKVAGFPTCDSSHFCTSKCDSQTECGNGYVCCDDICKVGTCCMDEDCGLNMKCINNICAKECEKDEDCESKKCCDKSICAEKDRGCCSSKECESSPFGFNCINYLCSCTSDYECPEDMICDKESKPPICKEGCSDIHRCKPDEMCCDGVCIKGVCCSSKDCIRAGYPTCKEINGKNMCVDECSPVAQNPCNSPDNKYRCCLQEDNKYKCVIANCCSNEDCKLPDKPFCEKALEKPDCVNRCEPEEIKCGEGYVCCKSFNDYMCIRGNCCESKECDNNKQCIGYHCVEADCKSEPSICKIDEKCCPSGLLEGVCYKGECCDDSECSNSTNGFKCLVSEFKCGCTTISDCKSGYVCKDGRCIAGDCVTDSDCKDPAKPICINNKCSPCQNSSQCKDAQKGDICCSGTCRYGDCCSSIPDCNDFITKPVCREGYCSPCLNNSECSSQKLGDKCCTRGVLAGDCYSGACCSSYDCIEVGVITKPICHTSDYNCYPCSSDIECINEFKDSALKCCSVKSSSVVGSCYKGECCDDSQCNIYQGRPRCDLKTNICVECLSDLDCGILGIDLVCCNNQCIRGNCCKSEDCVRKNIGNYCYEYHCRQQCKRKEECTGTSIYSDCCSNITKYPFPFCVYETQGKCCIKDTDCGNLMKCCYGICVPSREICH